jgi:hypothetical protein
MKVLMWVVGVVAVVVLLFTVVFPWFDNTFVTDPVLNEAPPAAPAAAEEAPTPYQPTPLEAFSDY